MATSPLVPGRLPVAIEDHAYQIEPTGFRRETVQVLRQQADQSAEPGEQSLNPQGLWRRSQESWHHGAGQDFLDGKTEEAADPHRFRRSKGVDVWTRGQVSLLHNTLEAWNSGSTNLQLAVAREAGGIFALYVADGTELYWSAIPFSGLNTIALQRGTGWTTANATIATDGAYFRLTATAAAVMSATSPAGTAGVLVQGGRSYGFAVGTDYIPSGGAARIPQINVNWYDSAGVFITSTAPVPAPGSDASQVNVIATAVAPAAATYVSVTVSFTTASVIGEIHQIVFVSVGPSDLSPIAAPDGWLMATIQAGDAAQQIQSITTNGSYVWAALGTSGIHRTAATNITSAANVPAAPAGGQIHLVGFAEPFLLAAGSTTSTTGKNTLWRVDNPLVGTPALSVIMTHDNSFFEWVGVAKGRSVIYAWGNSGGNGHVYKITFDQNTGTLSTAASPATSLPDGETIHSLYFYAGGIIMGTGKGVRLGQADGAGNIDYGPLVETSWPVQCLEPQGRYCWFGWTRYDEFNSGLGRVDLGYFTDTLTPAYASDLMTYWASSGDVTSCVMFSPYGYEAQQRPPVLAFAVAGDGVYVEDPYFRAPWGDLETGAIRFSTSEPKTIRSLDIRHHALPSGGSVDAELQRDASGTWTLLGTSATTGSYGPAVPLDAGSLAAEALEVRLTVNRPPASGTDFSRTPELTRWTVKVLPTPSTIDETFTIPILLRREVVDNNDANYPVDVAAELTYLKGLERSRALVTLQLGAEQHTVYLAASQFEGQSWGRGKQQIEGILTTVWQTVRG